MLAIDIFLTCKYHNIEEEEELDSIIHTLLENMTEEEKISLLFEFKILKVMIEMGMEIK